MIVPLLLCGGSGSRLWPLSRANYPKQFIELLGPRSLLQSAAQRFSGPGFADPILATHSALRFLVQEQLDRIAQPYDLILLEPAPRNTAPAVLSAALALAARAPETVMLVAPCDHVIADAPACRRAITRALPAAQAGQIVCFGVPPTAPETGFGYLELDAPLPQDGVGRLRRFVEKPTREAAEQMQRSGTHLWNSGLFLFTAQTILAAFETHAPALLDPVRRALAQATREGDRLQLAAAPWEELEPISLDYAVMEHLPDLAVVPLDSPWSDLGSWETVWQALDPDPAGVAGHNHSLAIACRDTLLHCSDPKTALVGLGLENIIAVVTPDAVLVADRRQSQDIPRAVAELRAQGAPQSDYSHRDHRPWGWFESLAMGPRFQVKRIVVKPGAAMSLQSHMHRAEHWVVVEGTAKVTLDQSEHLITENQSLYVPLGMRHRLENPGKVPVTMIEVQTGSYLGEDDIERFEDRYGPR